MTAAPVVSQMSADEYFALPGLSASGMKDLAVSPLRYWFRHINPDRPQDSPTPEMIFGSAVHCALLEPSRFDEHYICEIDETDFDGCLRTVAEMREFILSKGYKPKGTLKADIVSQVQAIDPHVPILDVEMAKFNASAAGKSVVKKDDWYRVANAAAALAREPVIIELLSDGQPEVSMFSVDPETGVPLKCRMDWISPTATLDLKTFSQMRGKPIDRTVIDAIWYEEYHRQAFLYSAVRKAATGVDCPFIFGFVESTQPHEVRIRSMAPSGDASLLWLRAKLEVRRLCRVYRDCVDRFGDSPWTTSRAVEPICDEEIPALAYA